MGVVAQRLQQFAQRLEPMLVDEMKGFAGEVEEWARDHKTWQKDTGSAQTALTGWVIDHEDHKKNYNKEPWLGAKEGRVRSKYSGPPYYNTPATYREAEEDVDVYGHEGVTSDDAVVTCLSHFVRYGLDLEEEPHGHLLKGTLDAFSGEFVRLCGRVFIGALG